MVNQNGNGKKPWGQIHEVRVKDIPPAQSTLWWELYTDLCLRLEQTMPTYALAVPFESYEVYNRAQVALRRTFEERKGEGAVKFEQRKSPDGSVTLYVSRGPNWGKEPTGENKAE